ncbi:histidinol-phosphatase HisJ family protein [Virgibacillus litoralis]|uniref:Histidinol-phosphatase n=1 Tax=Virgibacillus litoralis TaxID=578221 RepID=A0ABS4HDJ8_9BACI|nr:histidinol-phosphatase HisJ family protein [Virgibacillus litoralis]MBP1948512.1 histidinol-phosphatase (PHP family) [Virgibacillus litoralis]
MFDYHVHSDFSADSTTPMEKTIEKAIELGLEEICFTDHIDYDYPDDSIVFYFDLEQYDEKIKELKAVYADSISIKKGVEIGIQPHLVKRYNDLLADRMFDFIICSMHTSEQKDLHSGRFFNNRSVDDSYLAYYEDLLYCVKNFNQYNVLGHIDLVKRYAKQNSTHDFHDILQQIFKEIVSKGKGIELNTSGIRYGLKNGMPSSDILRLYKECGGEILTLGSDSHVESTLAYDFKESLDMLKGLGFNYIATFNNGVPVFHNITKL